MIAHGDVYVGQASHAWLAGQMARAWGNSRFARPEPFEDVCLAVEQHDIGMAEWDRAPSLHPDGSPVTFLQMPTELHVELWSAAPGKLLTQSPYAALLVSLHGTALQGNRRHLPLVEAFVAEQEALQAELLTALGEDAECVDRNRRLLWALDSLSLSLLLADWMPGAVAAPTRPGEPDVELRFGAAGARHATVTPWPFAASTLEVGCRGRWLRPGERFDQAPWVRLDFRLAPA